MRVMNSVCLARELCFTESVLCRQAVCFQVQWRLVVFRVVRAKGSLSHEPHQLMAGPYTSPLQSNTWQNLSPPWEASVSDSSPPCQKVGHRCSWVDVFFFLFFLSGFCHTLTWISHGYTCIPHPDPPSHLPPTWSLWVFPVHQVRALVSCIQPGLVICFTLDNIHVLMLLGEAVTDLKRAFQRWYADAPIVQSAMKRQAWQEIGLWDGQKVGWPPALVYLGLRDFSGLKPGHSQVDQDGQSPQKMIVFLCTSL